MLTTLTVRFSDVAMMPCQEVQPRDNAAIAIFSLPAGTKLLTTASELIGGDAPQSPIEIVLRQPVLEGHRFVVVDVVDAGEELRSWGLPFGIATRTLHRGDVLMNELMLRALRDRSEFFPTTLPIGRPFELSADEARQQDDVIRSFIACAPANFHDPDTSADNEFVVDEKKIVPRGTNAQQIADAGNRVRSASPCFQGFDRRGALYHLLPGLALDRGSVSGTRNHVLVVSLTALSAPTVRQLAQRHKEQRKAAAATSGRDDFDGVCFAPHTEGEAPVLNNAHLVLRCLLGWIMHPNVSAVIAVFTGEERVITKTALSEFIRGHAAEYGRVSAVSDDDPSPTTLHLQWLDATSARLNVDYDEAVARAEALARAMHRTPCPLSDVNIALQCGGSDAFSGVTGNALAGAVAEHMMIHFGAAANIAESPELVGAESYMLENVASLDVARDFVRTTEAYKQFASRHGQNAAGNPSGGNLFRGLYNIVLKSIGAARKKPPSVTLDAVISYGAPMPPSAYAFMDSPGNDLESIAGQVASGCNIIFFITGNGAITNFPFVPTLKFVTTTARFRLLEHDMDIDAGCFARVPRSAEPLNLRDWQRAMTLDCVQRVVDVCGGSQSKGELSGHSQVSIWRNWFRGDGDAINRDNSSISAVQPPIAVMPHLPEFTFKKGATSLLPPTPHGGARGIGLVWPTSICSSEVAAIAAAQLNACAHPLRWVATRHTEGCAAAGGPDYEQAYKRLALGFITHPLVKRVVLLEHGCEKTHNDYFRAFFRETPVVADLLQDSAYVTFASVQKDGGNESVVKKIAETLGRSDMACCCPDVQSSLTRPHRTRQVGVVTTKTDDRVALVAANVVRHLVNVAKFGVVLPQSSSLLDSAVFRGNCLVEGAAISSTGKWSDVWTIPFAQPLHIFAAPQSTAVAAVNIMAVDDSMSWPEIVSGMSSCCEVLVLLTSLPATHLQLVSGSVLVPTIRVSTSKRQLSNGGTGEEPLMEIAERLCVEVCAAMQHPFAKEEWFATADFCVPRSVSGVSL